MNKKQGWDRLLALRNNLPSSTTTEQKYVVEFHNILDVLQKESGQDLGASRLPESEMRRRKTSWNTLTGDAHMSEHPECDRSFLLMKIDPLLAIFAVLAKPTELGFHVDPRGTELRQKNAAHKNQAT